MLVGQTKRANERSFVYRHQHGGDDVTWKPPILQLNTFVTAPKNSRYRQNQNTARLAPTNRNYTLPVPFNIHEGSATGIFERQKNTHRKESCKENLLGCVWRESFLSPTKNKKWKPLKKLRLLTNVNDSLTRSNSWIKNKPGIFKEAESWLSFRARNRQAEFGLHCTRQGTEMSCKKQFNELEIVVSIYTVARLKFSPAWDVFEKVFARNGMCEKHALFVQQ